jgi:hypothetical protein
MPDPDHLRGFQAKACLVANRTADALAGEWRNSERPLSVPDLLHQALIAITPDDFRDLPPRYARVADALKLVARAASVARGKPPAATWQELWDAIRTIREEVREHQRAEREEQLAGMSWADDDPQAVVALGPSPGTPASPAAAPSLGEVQTPTSIRGDRQEDAQRCQPADALGHANAADGTSDERVGRYLETYPNPSIGEATQITALSELRIRRTRAWQEYEEKALDAYLLKHPDAGTPDVEQEFGFSPAKTVGMDAWKAHAQRRDAAKPLPKGRERQLTDSIAKCLSNEGAGDPTKPVEAREEIVRWIIEKADKDTRGKLNRLTSSERDAMLEHILTTCETDNLAGQAGERKLAIILEVVRSWLEDREQEHKHGRRNRGRP